MQDNTEHLSPLTHALVLHFGEMGNRWGINRTVGQIYALLVFVESPLNAEQIASLLSFSRSNVSMGLKELASWDLVNLKHLPGDRRDYFTVPEDVWEIAKTLILQRRKRELEPTLTELRNHLVDANPAEEYAISRMQEMHDFMELIVQWTDDMDSLSRTDLDRLIKLGAGVNKVLDFTRRGKSEAS